MYWPRCSRPCIVTILAETSSEIRVGSRHPNKVPRPFLIECGNIGAPRNVTISD